MKNSKLEAVARVLCRQNNDYPNEKVDYNREGRRWADYKTEARAVLRAIAKSLKGKPVLRAGHAQNCIALSSDFHTDKRYDAFYNNYRGGFLEIYQLIEEMASILTDYEESRGGCSGAWDNAPGDWTEVCEAFVDEVYKADYYFNLELKQCFERALARFAKRRVA